MKVAIIAGRDRLAVEAAKNLKAEGHEIIAFTFEDEVMADMAPVSDTVHCFSLTQVGKILKTLKQLNVEALVFAGKFHKIVLDKNLKFDIKALWMLAKLKDRRDDTIMLAIVEEIEKLGIKILSQADVLKNLLVNEGVYTKKRPNKAEMEDIHFGYRMAKGIAGLDIGQSIIVRKKNVVAVEALEGTDQLILRSGELTPKGGFTLVKVAKPQQDMRFDMPVIGMTTLKNMVKAGGSVIAFEAGKTLIMDKEECINFLNENNVIFMGYIPKAQAADFSQC